MSQLQNVKLILDLSDTTEDGVLSLYLSRAANFVLSYCNVEDLTPPLEEIVEDIAVYSYRNKGIENVKSETKGSLGESYHERLPDDYYSRLNRHRRMKFV